MNGAVYNEIEPFACGWLERLIAAGHIGPGIVERRSIADLTPADVAGPGQRHFFAGIGVWSAALRLAGVPDDADIWTGSCPCQPFSDAGTRSGVRDPRHLWPTWFELIRECRPAIVFGEQVASRDGLGWLDVVRADLERSGYAFGASDLCAAGVGAPHIRQRLYFVAYAASRAGDGRIRRGQNEADINGESSRSSGQRNAANGTSRVLVDAETRRRRARRNGESDGRSSVELDGPSAPRLVGNTNRESGRRDARAVSSSQGETEREGPIDGRRAYGPRSAGDVGFWSDAEWIPCTDGKSRPVEPGTFPLAYGATARVGRLRGYGNAIVRQVAATFVRAALDAIEGG